MTAREWSLLEALVKRAGRVVSKQDLEQLISSFAVSSAGIRDANLKAARRKYSTSSDVIDKRVAEADEIREHCGEHGVEPPKKKK